MAGASRLGGSGPNPKIHPGEMPAGGVLTFPIHIPHCHSTSASNGPKVETPTMLTCHLARLYTWMLCSNDNRELPLQATDILLDRGAHTPRFHWNKAWKLTGRAADRAEALPGNHGDCGADPLLNSVKSPQAICSWFVYCSECIIH